MRRALERKVRSAKKQYLSENAAGIDSSAAASKLAQARRSLSSFIRDTGGRVDSSRTSVNGFGRSAASRAAWSDKQSLASKQSRDIIRPIQADGSEKKIEATVVGNLNSSLLKDSFGKLHTNEVIVTDERISHIKERHPEDYSLFQEYGGDTVSDPDILIRDTRHTGTVFAIRKMPETNLNVIIRLALDTDNPEYKNSVMTFYRIREKNLQKLISKHEILYKKE